MTPEELPPAARPGTILGGRYRVERVLGQGGMGLVLVATHVELGKRVAIKLLLARPHDVTVARFRREAQIASQLSSPHLAQVLDSGSHDNLPFLVMELLEGHDLQRELTLRGRLPVHEAVDWVLEASIGLAHAHARGLTHRDVKPANLFLAQVAPGRRTVKVLDFGLLKDGGDTAPALTASAEVFGTPQYMAPEQIKSSKNVDPRCDQHALALVLHELIAGRPVYDAETLPQLIVNIAMEPPTPLGHLAAVPPGLEGVVLRALAKRPDDRFPHLAAFAMALAPFGTPRAAALAADVAGTLGVPAVAADPGAPAAWPAPAAMGDPRASLASAPMMAAGPAAPGPPRAIPLGTLSSGAMSQRAGDLAAAGVTASPARAPSPVLMLALGALGVGILAVVGLVVALSRPGAAPAAASDPPPSSAASDPAPSAPPATAPGVAVSAVAPAPPAPAESAATSAASPPSAAPPPSSAAASTAPPRRTATPKVPPPPKPPPRKSCTGLDCY